MTKFNWRFFSFRQTSVLIEVNYFNFEKKIERGDIHILNNIRPFGDVEGVYCKISCLKIDGLRKFTQATHANISLTLSMNGIYQKRMRGDQETKQIAN